MKLKGKTVWIIGASAGIGEYVAYECAARGAKHIILSARRAMELERVKQQVEELGPVASVEVLDITDTAAIDGVCDDLRARHSRIDLIIHNSGVTQRALVIDAEPELDRTFMEINFLGHARIARRMLPMMIDQGGGHFAITSSVTGKFGFPLRSAYSASKHALHGFFEALYFENHMYGIKTTLICPGQVRTQVSNNALTADGKPQNRMDRGQARGMRVEECARRFVRAIERDKREVYFARGAILIYFRRYMPFLFYFFAKNASPR